MDLQDRPIISSIWFPFNFHNKIVIIQDRSQCVELHCLVNILHIKLHCNREVRDMAASPSPTTPKVVSVKIFNTPWWEYSIPQSNIYILAHEIYILYLKIYPWSFYRFSAKIISIFFIVHKIILEKLIQHKLILWQVNMTKVKNNGGMGAPTVG